MSKSITGAKIADRILLWMTAILIPNIFLFFFFEQNRLLNHLLLEHVLVVSAFLMAISAIIFALLILSTQSKQIALLVTLLFWISFWTFGHSLAFMRRSNANMPELFWFVLLLIILVVIAVLLRLYFPMIKKYNTAFRVLAIFLCVLFLLNFIPSMFRDTGPMTTRLNEDDTNLGGSNIAPYVKQDFNVSPNLPSPDIYWFHMDGMMSLVTMERLFDSPQDDLREELMRRGFVEYEDARMTASTPLSLIALFSPNFYDEFLHTHLYDTRYLYGGYQIKELVQRFSQHGIHYNTNIIPYLETMKAFMESGYDVISIGPIETPHIGAMPFHRIYDILRIYGAEDSIEYILSDHQAEYVNLDTAWHRFLRDSGNLVDLLTLTTPLSIFSDLLILPDIQYFHVPSHIESISQYLEVIDTSHARVLYRSLFDLLENPLHQSPKFVFMAHYFTHTIFGWVFSDVSFQDMTFMEGYPTSFFYAKVTMLNSIDIILESNPDAVIVLQSDHGFNHNVDWEGLRRLGLSEDEIIELSHSTISFVRIPQRYGGLTEPLSPVNISRELVNRFVGPNYTLLP